MTLTSVVISAAKARPSSGTEVGVVVHVAVEGGGHVRALHPVGLLGAHRVGVRLGDDADAGPPGVTQHERLGVGPAEGQAQQGVVGDGGPEGGGVVPQLADLGGGLVDEGEVAVGDPDGAGDEAVVVVPALEQGLDGRRRQIQPMAVDQDVDAGAVPTSHLQAVEGGQHLLQREVGRRSRPGPARRRPARRPAPPWAGDRGGRPRPHRAGRRARRSPARGRRWSRSTRRGRGRLRPRRPGPRCRPRADRGPA